MILPFKVFGIVNNRGLLSHLHRLIQPSRTFGCYNFGFQQSIGKRNEENYNMYTKESEIKIMLLNFIVILSRE